MSPETEAHLDECGAEGQPTKVLSSAGVGHSRTKTSPIRSNIAFGDADFGKDATLNGTFPLPTITEPLLERSHGIIGMFRGDIGHDQMYPLEESAFDDAVNPSRHACMAKMSASKKTRKRRYQVSARAMTKRAKKNGTLIDSGANGNVLGNNVSKPPDWYTDRKVDVTGIQDHTANDL